MPKIVFETGNKVNLTLIKRGNIFSVKPVEDTVYSCSILHVISEKQLVISVPLIGNTLLSMTVNDIYSAGNLGVLLESDQCVEELLRLHQGCRYRFALQDGTWDFS